MASEAGRPSSGLRRSLEDSPDRFSLFQALRLLEFSEPGSPPLGLRGPFERESVRLRAFPSLSYLPLSDVRTARQAAGQRGGQDLRTDKKAAG